MHFNIEDLCDAFFESVAPAAIIVLLGVLCNNFIYMWLGGLLSIWITLGER